MEKYSRLILIILVIGFLSCKKQVIVDPEINVDKVYIELVKSDRVDINYSLSNLGYQETGVAYSKKSDPSAASYINAVRVDGKLKLALQNLDANTDYVFRVFYKQNNERKLDPKEYTVKTLVKEALNFALQVKSTSISYDDDGNFITDIEGENLNNLNLKELELKVGFTKVSFSYPILVSGSKYKITLKGVVNPINVSNAIIAYYQGKEILFQSVPFVYDGDRFWLTYKPANLNGYIASVFNSNLYYFYDNQIFRWNDVEQRMISLGAIPNGTIQTNTIGLQFDGQLFFPVTPKTTWPNPKDLSDFYNYPEAYSYEVASGKWTSFPFQAQQYGKRNRMIESAKYFIHKNELYLAYTLRDDPGAIPATNINIDNFLYHYNKGTKQFENITNFNTQIINYSFSSINNQLYLSGLAPVYDQDFNVSATFTVYRVEDNFSLTEVFRAGTVASPLSIMSKHTTVYDQKILIGITPSDFLLFDPISKQLSQVYLKNNVNHSYLSGFFTYNNKLHINADSKNYEISIAKGR